MAFHPALTNPDILRAIFEHVAVSCDSESEPDGHVFSRRQLAWAARSCKPFCEPALNALWRKMDDLTPLFKILTVFQEVDGVYMIRGTINADNMTRFHQYACRVTELVYYPDAGRRIDSSVYFQLAQLCGTRPLLPSLCDLRCSPSTEMLLFPSSTLSRLKLDITSDATDQAVGSFLFMLADTNPPLTYLAVTGNLTRLALESIGGFKELHSLDLRETTSVDMTILRAISSFTHLTRLEINLQGARLEPECIWDPSGFLSLRHLSVLGRDPRQVSWFLRAIHNCALHSIDMCVVSTQQEQAHGKPMHEFEKEWCQFFEKLPQQSLRHIRMGYLHGVPTLYKPIAKKVKKRSTGFAPPVRTRSIIGPLLQIRGLECVDFLSFPSLPLSDEDVHDIASAWPNIVTLALPNAVTGQPTFASLQYLSTLCPHLTSLALNIDSSNFSTVELTTVFPHPLRTWVAGDTQFNDTILLAQHLNRIFPALDQIDGAKSTESRIQELLRLCQAVSAWAKAPPSSAAPMPRSKSPAVTHASIPSHPTYSRCEDNLGQGNSIQNLVSLTLSNTDSVKQGSPVNYGSTDDPSALSPMTKQPTPQPVPMQAWPPYMYNGVLPEHQYMYIYPQQRWHVPQQHLIPHQQHQPQLHHPHSGPGTPQGGMPMSPRHPPPPLQPPGTPTQSHAHVAQNGTPTQSHAHVAQNTAPSPHPTQPSHARPSSSSFSSQLATPSIDGGSSLPQVVPRLNTNANAFVSHRGGSKVTIKSVDGTEMDLGSLKAQQAAGQQQNQSWHESTVSFDEDEDWSL